MARPPAIEPGFKVLTQDYLASDDPNDSYWGRGRVFVKPRRDELPMRVAYEFLAARLASAAGLPIPTGEVGQDEDRRKVWVSAVIDLQGVDPAPEDPDKVALQWPEISAGIFVFDVWILNSDRHDENIVSHPKLGLWMIDHEKSFGEIHVSRPEDLTAVEDKALTYHVFRDVALDDKNLNDWSNRVQGIPPTAIRRAVQEGFQRNLYTAPVRDSLTTFLLRRQGNVHRLVKRSRPARPKWRTARSRNGTSEGGQDA